jgi:hypothetical protein
MSIASEQQNVVLIGQNGNLSGAAGIHDNAVIIVNRTFTTVAGSSNSVVVGGPDSVEPDSVAIGRSSRTAAGAVAVGRTANATGANSIALGSTTTASGVGSVAIGNACNTAVNGECKIGQAGGADALFLTVTSAAVTDGSTVGALNLIGSVKQIIAAITSTSGHKAGHYLSATVTPSAASTSDYIGFENITTKSGTFDHAGIIGSSLTVNVTATGGTLTRAVGLNATLTVNGAGSTTTNAYLFLGSYTYTAGTIGSLYGLYLPSMTGATNNYAIYTNAGLIRLGDTTAAISTTVAAVTVAGGLGVSGSIFSKALNATQGTITDPEIGLSTTATWNDVADTFTHWQCNVTDTNSAAGSLLMALRIGSVGVYCVGKDGSVYFGDPTVDGCWRFTRSGNDLLLQRRETSNFITKYSFLA